MVVDGETGWLVPIEQATDGTGTPLDPERYVADLAAALVDAVCDPDRARTRGLAGRTARPGVVQLAGDRRADPGDLPFDRRGLAVAMHDRSALGPADVSDEQLAGMVADLFGADPGSTTILASSAEEFPYALPAITTAGRYWVSGTAEVDGEQQPFRVFVKHVQSWARHPFFEFVPTEYQEQAAAGVPWRTEALVYRSDLTERLPEGLSMPRALGVFDLDEESNAIWLEEVPVVDREWDLDRFARAGVLVGRHAASPRVRELAPSVGHTNTVRDYHYGRLAMQVLPVLDDERIWHHPLVADVFDDVLRDRLRSAPRAAPRTTPTSSTRCPSSPPTATPAPTTCWPATGPTTSC